MWCNKFYKHRYVRWSTLGDAMTQAYSNEHTCLWPLYKQNNTIHTNFKPRCRRYTCVTATKLVSMRENSQASSVSTRMVNSSANSAAPLSTVTSASGWKAIVQRQSTPKSLQMQMTRSQPSNPSKNDFKSKLVETFLAADIPLYKLNNSRIKQVFADLGQPMPSESSCRAHVDVPASKEMQCIKARLHGKRIFLVMDVHTF